MWRSRSARSQVYRRNGEAGFALLEALIAAVLTVVIVVGAGMTYLVADRSFRWGSKKLLAQQEATVLSGAFTRAVRNGSGISVYQSPDRDTKRNQGNGLVVSYLNGTPPRYLEWDAEAGKMVDGTGQAISAAKLPRAEFQVDPVHPKSVRFIYAVDDGLGNQVDVETSATARN